MYVISIVLFNFRSNFMFKIQLFICNVNETFITLIILIFLFYRENLQKWKKYTRNAYELIMFETLLYVPVRFRHDSPSPYLRTYFNDDPLQFMTMKVCSSQKIFSPPTKMFEILSAIGSFCQNYLYTNM